MLLGAVRDSVSESRREQCVHMTLKSFKSFNHAGLDEGSARARAAGGRTEGQAAAGPFFFQQLVDYLLPVGQLGAFTGIIKFHLFSSMPNVILSYRYMGLHATIS